MAHVPLGLRAYRVLAEAAAPLLALSAGYKAGRLGVVRLLPETAAEDISESFVDDSWLARVVGTNAGACESPSTSWE